MELCSSQILFMLITCQILSYIILYLSTRHARLKSTLLYGVVQCTYKYDTSWVPLKKPTDEVLFNYIFGKFVQNLFLRHLNDLLPRSLFPRSFN